jgi:hypothetical protein
MKKKKKISSNIINLHAALSSKPIANKEVWFSTWV